MPDLKSMNLDELGEYIVSIGESKYRAGQIYAFLNKGASFAEMTSLPLSLRSKLAAECTDTVAKVTDRRISSDGTQKFLYAFEDGENVETVLMKYSYGNSICLSTQAGCRMGCSFCASTVNGFRRNLTAGEILEQIIRTQTVTGEKVGHIVLMGIGEPLDNYDNVVRFLNLVNDARGLNIGMRHISLSTCGLIEHIDDLASLGLQLTLSVSLHAPNGEIRSRIMPVAKRYDYDALLDACERYAQKTGRRVSFEYAMIDGVNDSEDCAKELGRRLAGTLSHVNLIPYNRVNEKTYEKSNKNAILLFTKTLSEYKISVTVRRSLGRDIDAACGQLRAKALVKQ